VAGTPRGPAVKPPASRYRIEERGRRLVTIDTWAASGAVDPLPPRNGTDAADVTPRTEHDSQAGRDLGNVQSLYETALRGGAQALTDRTLVTKNWFDLRGPRTITLSSLMAQELYVAIIVSLAAPLALFVIWLLFGWFGLFATGAIMAQLAHGGKARERLAGWLDRGDPDAVL
jgi:hypothetical protein